MKICKDLPDPPSKHTHMKGKGGGKTNCETSSMKSYRDNLTTYLTTELMTNSVQYAHLGGGGGEYKIEKVSLLRIDANLSIAKTL